MNNIEETMIGVLYNEFKKSNLFIDCLMGLNFNRGCESFLKNIGINDLELIKILKSFYDKDFEIYVEKIKKINNLPNCNYDCKRCNLQNNIFCPYKFKGINK